ncbi:acyltransferase [Cryobacterium sp. TMT1-66-1]|uniref:acyltransferase family protein n=1 Tax=Cryobacterium sp. TMT1-66-1 TaxID=1259242 RepID=UPI00106C65AD|nr:acyltransferase [Cryobacterium sp. TMT1-66-1]TFD07009.1 acyltransferase [Cryobacterium sp. TMT1-66-1]
MRQLRLLAGVAVVVGHGYVLNGITPAPRVGGIPLHTLGLYIFFTISGYLITSSWNRWPNLPSFVRNRALRILPALAAVVLLTVVVIGPLATDLTLREYLSTSQTWLYLSGVLLVPQYELPGVFDSHVSPAVNGSLWTLGIEACCYLATALLGLALRRFAWIGTLVLGSVAIALALQPAGSSLESLRPAGAVCSYFAIGALACHLRMDRRHFPTVLIVGLAIGWVLLGEFNAPVATTAAWLVVPATVLAIALRSRESSSGVDLSYGVYLWGYPIQQLVIQVNPDLPVTFSVALTIVFTLAVATLSWHHLEAPALGLKRPARPEPIQRLQLKSALGATTA